MSMRIEKKAGTPSEMSRMYGVPEGSLANMRYRKAGPKFYKVGRRVLYFFEDFEAWLKQNPVLTKDSLD